AGCSLSGTSWMAVVAAATTASLTRGCYRCCGIWLDVSKSPHPALLLALGDLAGYHLAVAPAGLRLPGHPLADRVQDGQTLADEPGGDLAQGVGAVERAGAWGRPGAP